MDAYLIDAVRTPFGRYRGGLSGIRTDDLAALPLAALAERHRDDIGSLDDVVLGNTNGAGEENRNVGRMAALLAGLPPTVPGTTVNRLCGSGGEAVIQAARAVAVGEADLVIAGGMEGMSRSPFVLPKPDEALPRQMELHQTTIGWRLINPKMPAEWVLDLGPAAEAVAAREGIGRAAQDDWAVRSQERAAAAWAKGLHDWVLPVEGVERDESVRARVTPQRLAVLAPAFAADGTITAGNAGPIGDGAVAVLLSSRRWLAGSGRAPLGRVLGSATIALEPDRYTLAAAPACLRLLDRLGLKFADIAVWEINEAYAAMVLSTLQLLRAESVVDDERVNPHGGAIAYGNPASAAMPRIVVDLCRELRRRGGGIGVAAGCIGVGQGMAIAVQVE